MIAVDMLKLLNFHALIILFANYRPVIDIHCHLRLTGWWLNLKTRTVQFYAASGLFVALG